MNVTRTRRTFWLGAVLSASAVTFVMPLHAQHYVRTDLVADLPNHAEKADAHLVNAWGLSRSSTSPWWVSNNGTGTSTLYDGSGTAATLVVTVPGSPTGTIYNGSADFLLGPGQPARFLFASEDGTISGWNSAASPGSAMVKVTTPGAIYKGLAMATVGGKNYLYATDFHNGRIDVFDASFQKVSSDDDNGGEDDLFRFRGNLRGFAAFGIQNIGGNLFITFAKQDNDKEDDVHGAGLGFVAAFSPQGRLLRSFEHVDALNAPWGLALAPGDFGSFSHHLLVGQFGSGEILAYNIETGRFAGKLLAADGKPITIDGLWGLGFGNGGNAGAFNSLYFAAGPGDEKSGLFGVLKPVATDLIQGNGN
jgi:uncharacterized protein (TIGR03118 family)